MAFTETLRMVMEVVTGDARAELDQFGATAQRNLDDTGTSALTFRSRMSSAIDDVVARSPTLTSAFDAMGLSGSRVTDFLATAAPLAAAAAAAAFTAFAVSSVGDFQDLAIAAGDMATATGLTVDQASRWIEVSDDLGVSTDSLETAMNRMNRAASAGTLAVLGIDADNANDRFLESIDYLAGITDETERAAVAQQIFGRGWQELTPLIEAHAELRDRMAEVSSQKLINDDEVAKAHAFRDLMDEFSDTIDNVKLAFGGFAAGFVVDVSTMVEAANEIAAINILPGNLEEALPSLSEGFGVLAASLVDMLPGIGGIRSGFQEFSALAEGVGNIIGGTDEEVVNLTGSFTNAAGAINFTNAAQERYDQQMQILTGSFINQAGAINNSAAASRDAAERADDLARITDILAAAQDNSADAFALANQRYAEQVEAVTGAERAQLDYETAQRGVADAIAAVDAAEREEEDAKRAVEAATRDVASALVDLSDAQLENRRAVEDLGVANAELAAAQADLQTLLRGTAASSEELADAQDDVASASRGVEDAQLRVRDSAQAVEDAQLGVRDAARAVETAQRALQDAYRAVDDATRGVTTAQNTLADAQVKQVRAAEDVTRAERDLAFAQAELNEVLASGDATAQEVARAQDAVEAASRRLEDAQVRVRDTAIGVTDAQIGVADAGIKVEDAHNRVETASIKVEDANNRVEAATIKVGDAERNLARAGQDLVTAQAELADAQNALNLLRVGGHATAEELADAEERVRDATRGVEDAQLRVRDSAIGVESAQIGVRDANLGVEDASRRVETATDGVTRAQQQVAPAVLNAADAAVALATMQGILNGKQLDSRGAVLVQIAALNDLKAVFPQLAPIIDAHIAKLVALEEPRNTPVTISVTPEEILADQLDGWAVLAKAEAQAAINRAGSVQLPVQLYVDPALPFDLIDLVDAGLGTRAIDWSAYPYVPPGT